jgi:hypothetical protein
VVPPVPVVTVDVPAVARVTTAVEEEGPLAMVVMEDQ